MCPEQQPIAPGIAVFQHLPEYYGYPSCQEPNEPTAGRADGAVPGCGHIHMYLRLQPRGLAPLLLSTFTHLIQPLCNVRPSHT